MERIILEARAAATALEPRNDTKHTRRNHRMYACAAERSGGMAEACRPEDVHSAHVILSNETAFRSKNTQVAPPTWVLESKRRAMRTLLTLGR